MRSAPSDVGLNTAARSDAADSRDTVERDTAPVGRRSTKWTTCGPWIAVVTFYVVASFVMLRPIFSVTEIAHASYPGDPRLNIWTLAWVDRFLLGGGAHFFDANIFYPAARSLAYSEHLFGIALFSLPVYALTHNATLSYNIVWFLAYPLTAISCHFMLKRFVDGHLPALFFGTLFTFSFFRMLHGHSHLQLLWAFWIPLIILSLDRWLSHPTWLASAGLAACLALQVLASWYLGVLSFVAVGLFVLAWSIEQLFAMTINRRQLPQLVTFRRVADIGCRALAILGIVSLATVPFALPYFSTIEAIPAEAGQFAAQAHDYVVPPADTWLGRVAASYGVGRPLWSFGERTVFLGYTSLALALVGAYGVASRRLRVPARLWIFSALLGVMALWLSLGPPGPRARLSWSPFSLLATLPGMQFFRAPARFALLVSFGVAILAALGISHLQSIRRRGTLAGTLMLLPLAMSESYLVGFPLGQPKAESIPLIYSYLAKLDDAPVVSLPSYRGRDDWWRGADYQLYSTAHWFPIVNGFSRGEPPDHFWIMGNMMAFPGENSAASMRKLGIRYVVLHAGRYADGARPILEEAATTTDFELLAQFGTDYLFEVTPTQAGRHDVATLAWLDTDAADPQRTEPCDRASAPRLAQCAAIPRHTRRGQR